MRRVLFVCVHNSGRSQMAAAIFNHLVRGKAEALSAGREPGETVLPTVVEAMAEAGIDVSGQRPKALTEETAQGAERVIAMGCNVREACPALRLSVEDWGIEDPSGQPIERVRQIRDKVWQRVEGLLREMGVGGYSREAM
ncbi:MAG: arsenate reductase ArsC [Dehalococcoidia bacterium]